MVMQTRRIGLSLGADICWPMCFEEILKRLQLEIPYRGDTLRFEVSRVTIEPFDLRQPVRYDVVVDRLTHWYHTSREWIKKAVVLNDLYVFNNPWSLQANEKHTTYCAMMRLGMPIPETWMLPPKSYNKTADLEPTLQRYAQLFDLGEVGKRIGYPLFMKPYDGGGWKGVTKIDTEAELKKAYDASGTDVMHLQAGVIPYDKFVRCIGLGPQTRVVNYDPSAPLHDRYTMDRSFISADEQRMLEDITLTINSFFGWDFNSCEALLKNHEWYPIDFANACPDSQVTSLHYHFPMARQSRILQAGRSSAPRTQAAHAQRTLDWDAYFEIARRRPSLSREAEGLCRRSRASALRRQSLRNSARNTCHISMPWPHEFFGSPMPRSKLIRKKVEALYPSHEWDGFTELFFQRIQQVARGRIAALSPRRHRSPADEERHDWSMEHARACPKPRAWCAGDTSARPCCCFPRPAATMKKSNDSSCIHVLERRSSRRVACKVYLGRQRRRQDLARRALTRRDYCSRVQNLFDAYIYEEVVPLIRRDCESADIEIIVAGASIGAFNAVASLCRHPDVFKLAIAMSGTFDLSKYLHGQSNQDFYFSSPLHYLPGLPEGHAQLMKLRTRRVLIPTGEGDYEDPAESWRLANTLGAQKVS